jgi:hypothetical protein
MGMVKQPSTDVSRASIVGDKDMCSFSPGLAQASLSS